MTFNKMEIFSKLRKKIKPNLFNIWQIVSRNNKYYLLKKFYRRHFCKAGLRRLYKFATTLEIDFDDLGSIELRLRRRAELKSIENADLGLDCIVAKPKLFAWRHMNIRRSCLKFF